MRARLRGPGGASTITLLDDATIGELVAQIVEKTSISSFDIKYGYPPQPLLLDQHEKSLPLSKLGVKLDGEQLTISARVDEAPETHKAEPSKQPSQASKPTTKTSEPSRGFSFTGLSTSPEKAEKKEKKDKKQVSLQRKAMAGDVPELPLPERGATLGTNIPTLEGHC